MESENWFSNFRDLIEENKDNANVLNLLKLVSSDLNKDPNERISTLITQLSRADIDNWQKNYILGSFDQILKKDCKKSEYFVFGDIGFKNEDLFNDFKKDPNKYILDCMNRILQHYSAHNFIQRIENFKFRIHELNAKIETMVSKNKYHKVTELMSEMKRLNQEFRLYIFHHKIFDHTVRHEDLYKQIRYNYLENFEILCKLRLLFDLFFHPNAHYEIFKHYSFTIRTIKNSLEIGLKKNKYLFGLENDQFLIEHLEEILRIIYYKNVENLKPKIILSHKGDDNNLTLEELVSKDYIQKIYSKKDDKFIIKDNETIGIYRGLFEKNVEHLLDEEMKRLIVSFHPKPSKCYLGNLIDREATISCLDIFIENKIKYWIDPSSEFFLPEEFKSEFIKTWEDFLKNPT